MVVESCSCFAWNGWKVEKYLIMQHIDYTWCSVPSLLSYKQVHREGRESCLFFVSLFFSFTALDAYDHIEETWESTEEKLTRLCKVRTSFPFHFSCYLFSWSLLGKVVVCQCSAITPHSSFKNQTTFVNNIIGLSFFFLFTFCMEIWNCQHAIEDFLKKKTICKS